MAKWLKKVGKVLGIMIAILVGLVLLAVLFLQTGPGKDFVKGRVVAAVNGALAGRITIDHLDGSLIGATQLDGVVLEDARNNVAARIPRATVDYDLLALLDSELLIESVSIDRPVVIARRYADGTLNLATIVRPTPQPKQPPSQFQVTVQQASINGGLAVWVDQQAAAKHLSDKALAGLNRWFDRLDQPDESTPDLAEQINSVVDRVQRGPVSIASATGIDLAGTFHTYGSATLGGRLEYLGAQIRTTATDRPHTMDAEDLSALRSPAHLEVTLSSLRAASLVKLDDLEAAMSFDTQMDELGNDVVVDIDEFIGGVARATATPKLIHLFAPEAAINDAMTASVTVGGTLEQLLYRAQVGCGKDSSATVAGTATIPRQDFSGASYDVAATFDALRPSQCIQTGDTHADLNGAVLADGTGAQPATLDTDLQVGLADSRVNEYRAGAVYLDASANDGTFRLSRLSALTPYGRANLHGMGDLDGSYRVDLEVDANDKLRNLSARLEQPEITTDFAHIRLQSHGEFNPDATTPLDYVERGDLWANWRLDDARVQSYGVGRSQGELTAHIGPAAGQPRARSVAFQTDFDGRRIDSPAVTVQFLSVEARGQGTLAVPVDDPLGALRALSSTWKVRLREWSAADAHIGRADVDARIDRAGPHAPFGWDLDGSIGDVRYQRNRLGKAVVDLQGAADIASHDDAASLVGLSATGAADIDHLDAGDTNVQAGHVRLDVSGRPPDIHGAIDLRATGVNAGGESFESIEARANLDDDRRFEVHARAKRAGNEVPLSLDATGGVGPDLRTFNLGSFQLDSPDGHLTIPRGATVEMTDRGVRIDHLSLQTDGQTISVDGTYQTRGKQNLHVQLDEVALGEIRDKFDLQTFLPPARATISGKASLEGTARRPIITVRLSVSEAYYGGYGPFSAHLEGTYAHRRIQLDTLTAKAYGTTVLTASGEFPLDLDLNGHFSVPATQSIDMDIAMPKLALDQFHEPFPVLEQNDVAGVVASNLYLGGTIRQPRIDLAFTGADLAVAGQIGGQSIQIQDVSTSLKASYQPPGNGRGGIDGRWRLSWRGRQIARANITSPMPLARWTRKMLDPDQPAPNWSQQLPSLPIEVGVHVDGLDLGDIPIQSLAQADASGTIAVDIQGDGTLSNPRLDVDVDLDDGGWNQYRDIFVSTTMKLRNQVADIQKLRVEWDSDEMLSASGRVPLPAETLVGDKPLADLPVDFEVQVNEFPVSKLSTIDYEFARYEGALAGYATISGTLSDPDIQGRAGLFNTEFSDGQQGSVALSFGAKDGRFNADVSLCRAYDTIMTATAKLPVTTDVVALADGASLLDDGPIHADISSDPLQLDQLVPARLLDAYISDASGTLAIDASVDGTVEQPTARGRLTLDNGKLSLPYFGRRFTDIQLDLKAANDRIALDTLHVAEGDSWLGAEAHMDLDDFQPKSLDATIKSKEFDVGGFASPMSIYLDSTVDITGDFANNTDTLDAHATELEVTLPESNGGDLHSTSLNEEVVVLDPQSDSTGAFDAGHLVSRPDGENAGPNKPLKIKFSADRGSWVHHPMADVEFKTDLTVNLTAARTSIVGAVDIIRGGASVLGKDFDVPEQENAIRFTGASPPNPALDLEALFYLDRDIVEQLGEPSEGRPRIIVQVRGRADTPKLALESDPALSETEIIYVLMTGRAPGQSGTGEQSRVSGLALGAASGVFASMLQEELTGTLPLDVVRVQPGEQGFSDARVQVGKYLTQDIFVAYIRRLGAEEGEGANIISVDYRFASDWSLKLESSEELTGKFNLFWDIY